jgi:nicotinamide-nucleotide amidase
MTTSLQAELIAVGDELLYGDIVNGNAAWLGQQLADAGVGLHHSEVVGDVEEDIADAVHAALSRADVVIMTGGLGPTQDDLTREGLARAAGVPLHRDATLEAELRQRFSDLRRVVPDMNYRQADLPHGATPLPNRRGTAPGIRLELAGPPPKIVYALPGVPHEMYAMFTEQVLPDLMRRAGRPAAIVHRVLRTAGMWESAVAEALADVVSQSKANGSNPAIAFLASQGQTRVRITARADDRQAALALIAPVEEAARAALGLGCYGVDDDSLEGVVHGLLREHGATVATAESLTGGLLAGRFTDVPGASETYLGGVVAYATELKHQLLGVPYDVLREHGAVSDETAMAMAAGVRERLGATYGLATTGVAGPDLQEGKPVGTLHIGIAGPDGASAHGLRLPGDRNLVRTYASVSALDALRRVLLARQAGRG